MTHTHALQPYLSTAANQVVLPFLSSDQRLLVSSKASNGELALFEGSGERGHTAPRHTHRDASETFVVLSGELLLDVDGERASAVAGDVALLPRGIAHTFVVVSPHARYLTLHTPGGFDEFVEQVSTEAAGGRAPDRSRLVEIANEHGIDIHGPGLTLDPPATAPTALVTPPIK